MTFKNATLAKLYYQSQRQLFSNDAYLVLASLEKRVREFLAQEVGHVNDKIEAHKLLARINIAQMQILENEAGEDLDGDGKVAGKDTLYCASK